MPWNSQAMETSRDLVHSEGMRIWCPGIHWKPRRNEDLMPWNSLETSKESGSDALQFVGNGNLERSSTQRRNQDLIPRRNQDLMPWNSSAMETSRDLLRKIWGDEDLMPSNNGNLERCCAENHRIWPVEFHISKTPE
jgi:hypothetical protein